MTPPQADGVFENHNKPAKIGGRTRNCYILDITKMKEKGLDVSEEWGDPWGSKEDNESD